LKVEKQGVMINPVRRLFFGICCLIFFSSAYAQKLTTEQWLEDLDYVVSNLKKHHPNLYYRVSEDTFGKAIDDAKNDIENSKTDLEAFMFLKKFVAFAQDGHTQLWDNGFLGISNLRFPLRVDQFSDGIFITVIEKKYKNYLGSEVIAINKMPIKDVLRLTALKTNMDTEFGRIRPSFQDITFPKTLLGLGIIDDEKKMTLTIKNKKEKIENLVIHAKEDSSPVLWSNRLNQAPAFGDYVSIEDLLGDDGLPLHLKKQGDNVEFFWFEKVKGSNTVYFQYNQVYEQRNHFESWNQFSDRFWEYVDSNHIDKIIIDIRYNDGGNARMAIPFVNQIIKRDIFRRGDNLFLLVGNRTYSASVIFMTELEAHTDAIFVGSPPASPFNFFSDMVRVGNLPNSGAGLGIASRQVDNSWHPQTEYFSPDIAATISSEEYFSGKDPVLEAALANKIVPVPKYAIKYGANKAFEYYKQLKTNYGHLDWWLQIKSAFLERSINSYGYRMMNQGKQKEAFELFYLNTMLFQDSSNVWDSFGEWHLMNKKNDLAKKYYKQSIKLNPKNLNAIEMLSKISSQN
jgi:tetratricopeptide (TPR) repeat protein